MGLESLLMTSGTLRSHDVHSCYNFSFSNRDGTQGDLLIGGEWFTQFNKSGYTDPPRGLLLGRNGSTSRIMWLKSCCTETFKVLYQYHRRSERVTGELHKNISKELKQKVHDMYLNNDVLIIFN